MLDLSFTKVADLPVAHIKNFYSENELKKIMDELEFLNSIERYKGAEEPGGPGTAYEDGVALKVGKGLHLNAVYDDCLLYTSPSPRDRTRSRMPSSA